MASGGTSYVAASAFFAYHWNDAFSSLDGVAWTSVTVTPGAAHIGTNVRSLSGSWVAKRAGNTPAFAYSDDALTWTDASGVSGDIFIHQFVAGHGLPTACDM